MLHFERGTVLVIGTTSEAQTLYATHLFRLTFGGLPMPIQEYQEADHVTLEHMLTDVVCEDEDDPAVSRMVSASRMGGGRKRKKKKRRRKPSDKSKPPRVPRPVVGQGRLISSTAVKWVGVRNIVAVGSLSNEGLSLDPMHEAWIGEKLYQPDKFPGLKLFVMITPDTDPERTVAVNIFTTGHCLLMGRAKPFQVARVFAQIKEHASKFIDKNVPLTSTARHLDRRRKNSAFARRDLELTHAEAEEHIAELVERAQADTIRRVMMMRM